MMSFAYIFPCPFTPLHLLPTKHYFPQPFCKDFSMQDDRADVYILTWTRKTIRNGPNFQTIPVFLFEYLLESNLLCEN